MPVSIIQNYTVVEKYKLLKDPEFIKSTCYLDNIKHSLEEELYTLLFSVHYVLHEFDDIIDSKDLCTQEKRLLANIFRQEFNDFFSDKKGKNKLCKSGAFYFLWEYLRTYSPQFRIAPSDIENYQNAFNVIEEVLDWPSMPHFDSENDLEAYNIRLFQPISRIVSGALFSDCKSVDEFDEFSGELHHLMIAIQVMNLLTGVKEDISVKQFFFPIPDFEKQVLSSQVFLKYYAIGIKELGYVKNIISHEKVGVEKAEFLRSLRDSFFSRGAICIKGIR